MPERKPRTKKAKQQAISQVLEEFERGKLKTPSGKTVTSRDRALAIALSYIKPDNGHKKKGK